MILSLDAVIAFLLLASSASVFLVSLENFDFSSREVAAQETADEVALFLQRNKISFNAVLNSEVDIKQLLQGVESYCIELTKAEKNFGDCNGEKVKRGFYVFEAGEIEEASVLVYFDDT